MFQDVVEIAGFLLNFPCANIKNLVLEFCGASYFPIEGTSDLQIQKAVCARRCVSVWLFPEAPQQQPPLPPDTDTPLPLPPPPTPHRFLREAFACDCRGRAVITLRNKPPPERQLYLTVVPRAVRLYPTSSTRGLSPKTPCKTQASLKHIQSEGVFPPAVVSPPHSGSGSQRGRSAWRSSPLQQQQQQQQQQQRCPRHEQYPSRHSP